MQELTKPTFAQSVRSGLTGSLKGLLVGGLIGALAGAAVGLVAGILSGGLLLPMVGAGIMTGASLMGSIGLTAGTVTGVMQSREQAQPSANDVVGVAKVAFAQGVSVGQGQAQEQTNFRDRIRAEQAARDTSHKR